MFERSGTCPLTVIEEEFERLIRSDAPLRVHGGDIGGLAPDRPLRLDELRRFLARGCWDWATRDRALSIIVHRASSGDARWIITLAAFLLPGLRHGAARLRAEVLLALEDVEAELVIAFVDTVMQPDIGDLVAERVAARVCGRAVTAARKSLRRFRPIVGVVELDQWVAAPAASSPSVDTLLDRAVRDHVLTPDDADLIARTRVDGSALTEVCASTGLSRKCLLQRRHRAEARLKRWLTFTAWGLVARHVQGHPSAVSTAGNGGRGTSNRGATGGQQPAAVQLVLAVAPGIPIPGMGRAAA